MASGNARDPEAVRAVHAWAWRRTGRCRAGRTRGRTCRALPSGPACACRSASRPGALAGSWRPPPRRYFVFDPAAALGVGLGVAHQHGGRAGRPVDREVTQTLTADVSGIEDADGLVGVEYSYRWIRVDGSDETRIGTDSSTYTVVGADIGKRIEVRVSFDDDEGFAEALESAPVQALNTPTEGAPAITGSPRVGMTLGADTSGIADRDGLENVSYAYRWIRIDGAEAAPIADADSASYVVTTADLGRQIRLQVVFEDDVGAPVTLETAPVTIRAAVPAVCPALPDLAEDRRRIWTGNVTVADLVLGSSSVFGRGYTGGVPFGGGVDISRSGRLSDGTFAVNGRDYTVRSLYAESGATGNLVFQLNRELRDADASSLSLHVCGEAYALGEARYSDTARGLAPTYVWPAGLDWSSAEGRTLHLSKANTPATGAPGVSGKARVGGVLTATTDGIRDSDGLDSPVYAYRWIRRDGTVGTVDTEVTSGANTYTLTEDDEGTRVRVEVSFSDDLGFAEMRAGAPLTVRAARVPAVCPAPDPAYPAPIWTGDVTVGAVEFAGTAIAHGFAEALGSLPAAGGLSDMDLTTRDGTYAISAAMASTGGSLVFGVDSRLTEAVTGRLVLHVCGEIYPFSEASYDSGNGRYSWPGAGLDWSGLDSVALALGGHPGDTNLAVNPSDTTPPGLFTRNGRHAPAVNDTGGLAVVVFDETVDHSNLPPFSAFTITADGNPVKLTNFGVGGNILNLNLSPRILRGQTVIFTYTDPAPGDDRYALQDTAQLPTATVKGLKSDASGTLSPRPTRSRQGRTRGWQGTNRLRGLADSPPRPTLEKRRTSRGYAHVEPIRRCAHFPDLVPFRDLTPSGAHARSRRARNGHATFPPPLPSNPPTGHSASPKSSQVVLNDVHCPCWLCAGTIPDEPGPPRS